MTDTDSSVSERFRYFPMQGECFNCGSFETRYIGQVFIDEKCCRCGIIVGGGFHRQNVDTDSDTEGDDAE